MTAVVAGLLPALRQTALDPRDALQEEPRGASAGRSARRLRSLLVAGEIALAAVLCVVTLLLARSATLLGERDHGFDGKRSADVQSADSRDCIQALRKRGRGFSTK